MLNFTFPPGSTDTTRPSTSSAGGSAAPIAGDADLTRLTEVTVELTVEVGRTRMSLGETMSLGQGSVVTLDRLAVGDIVERAVPALVAQPGQLRTSLRGMSFLNRLESWEVRGDRLMMRGKP